VKNFSKKKDLEFKQIKKLKADKKINIVKKVLWNSIFLSERI
tara:strand:+ start:662 stop:787 length:126 start_codon:yes stop_codon:yes gene_type:complete